MQVKILHKERLNSETTRFVLAKPWDFKAGQYTTLCHSRADGNPEYHYFSISSSPLDKDLELDIQNSLNHPLNPDLAQFLQQAISLDLSPPAGVAVLQDNNRPLILVAGGSGIAPMRSIAKAAPTREIHLYWGARKREYFHSLDPLSYIGVLSEEQAPGFRHGLVHEAVLADFSDLSSYDIYLAGPFAMSYAAREAFLKRGAQLNTIFSDAFAFSTTAN